MNIYDAFIYSHVISKFQLSTFLSHKTIKKNYEYLHVRTSRSPSKLTKPQSPRHTTIAEANLKEIPY